ncbi:hypothetical protein LSAT2_014299 [Lamellibrachia satsuma]|nr:hypothetical protein LSAT2_014299 [Lamellibrachia satsuma]
MKSYDALITTTILLLVGRGYCLDPCKTKVCPAGTFCVSAEPNCNQPPCSWVATCVAKVSPAICPKLTCSPCPLNHIRKLDSAGCETCQCYDPCQGVKCPPNQECVFRRSDGCVRAGCVGKLMCHGWSDPHYFTFDGAEIHYMGVGEYMLSERSPECEDLRDFQLLVEQEHRYGGTSVSYVKSITLTLPDTVKLKIGRHRKQTVLAKKQDVLKFLDELGVNQTVQKYYQDALSDANYTYVGMQDIAESEDGEGDRA